MRSPDQFATLGCQIISLHDWFPASEVLGKRRQIMELIMNLSSLNQNQANPSDAENGSLEKDDRADFNQMIISV